ncbi:MAG: acyl-CoA dehydratase activase [Pseudomonadota bacterium]
MNTQNKNIYIGLDIGASSLKYIVKTKNEILDIDRIPLKGNLNESLVAFLCKITKNYTDQVFKIGVTGKGKDLFANFTKIKTINDIIATSVGVWISYPNVKSIIEIGAETSKWISIITENNSTQPTIIDYAINEHCAAGSGSFIEQQSCRLKIDIETFSHLAANAQKPAAVAGRCSVFAKSDMIHLQQKGIPIDEIVYGLCIALARNFMTAVLKGKNLNLPVAFIGGTSRNEGIIRAFTKILNLNKTDLIIPETPDMYSALGASIIVENESDFLDAQYINHISNELQSASSSNIRFLPRLGKIEEVLPQEPQINTDAVIKAYIGLDVGSVSTNFVVVSDKKEIIKGIYLPTKGRPVDVIKECLDIVNKEYKDKLEILGVCTTGSGRYLASSVMGADIIKNEITCQQAGSTAHCPDVDTIFEIGGQDSKFITVKDGKIKDFTMNKICAAGTGSFIEEQCEYLGLDVKNDFSKLAELSQKPIDLGSNCTVFMETEILNAKHNGVKTEDICASIAYSVAHNYLEKVADENKVGNNIIFQGGVASNGAVVKACSKILGKEIKIHPYNRISGALGAAYIAINEVKAKSVFKGFECIKDYSMETFECKACTNNCDVSKIKIGDTVSFFGDICEKFTSQKAMSNKSDKNLLDLRTDLIKKICCSQNIKTKENPWKLRIGIPNSSLFHDFFPFWYTFFNSLGFEVVVSPSTNMKILEAANKVLPAEVCLPIKVTFGHVAILDKEDIDYIFIPNILDFTDNDFANSKWATCPYAHSVPFMTKNISKKPFLMPSLSFISDDETFTEKMMETLTDVPLERSEIKEAFKKAKAEYSDYNSKLIDLYKDHIKTENKKHKFLIIGKPYNVMDAFCNLNLVSHIQKLGHTAIPMQMVPFGNINLTDNYHSIPWKFNRDLIKATIYAIENEMYPIIVSNFGCGPDAFTYKHLMKLVEKTHNLFLEFDEHRHEAGLITRLEAFIDEIEMDKEKVSNKSIPCLKEDNTIIKQFRQKPVYIPYFSDHAFAFSGLLRSFGIEAHILPVPDAETIRLGEKHSTGKECHAYPMITGDLMKVVNMHKKDEAIFFFPGTKIPCMLQQYGQSQHLLLNNLGINNIKIADLNFDRQKELFGIAGGKRLWEAFITIDLLIKTVCELRPYELIAGSVDRAHRLNLKDIEAGLALDTLHEAIEVCVKRLDSIEILKDKKRPIIGIAGDVYTRVNAQANQNLFKQIEKLGCQAWPSPFMVDIVDFGFRKNMEEDLFSGNFQDFFRTSALVLLKNFGKWRVSRNFNALLPSYHEPDPDEVIKLVAPYLSKDANEVLVLNIAKIIDFAKRGADGIINAMCFNCMFGMISSTIIDKIRNDFDNIPISTLIYTLNPSTTINTKLEAFVHQVKVFNENKVPPKPKRFDLFSRTVSV